jgi:DNA-binding LytR/AlgR family response regulator
MIKCVIIDKDKTGRKQTEECVAQFAHLTLIKSCGTIAEAVDAIKENKVDIIFLTIPPEVGSSLDFLKFMKYERPQLVFISEEKKLAKEAFDYDAADFILKPVTVERIAKAVSKAIKTETGVKPADFQTNSNVLFIKDKKNYYRTNLKDISMVEALSDYVSIYAKGKRFVVHATMKSMEKKLPQDQFVRIHNSYIVRLDRVSEITKDSVTVDDRELPVSHTYKKLLMERLKLV